MLFIQRCIVAGNRQFCSRYRSSTFSVVQAVRKFLSESIDLFTDTAAILNCLDLRSIMGCPAGTRSVITRAFRAKRELHCIFLEKKAIIITSKHGHNYLFFPLQSFSRKTQRKIGPKRGRKMLSEYIG